MKFCVVVAGGFEIQAECYKYVKQHGQLLSGQVYVSCSGKLPCKKIIHAVGPIWEGGRNNEDINLYVAIYDSLATAEKLGFSSIVLPALSCGEYGFPIERATRGIVCAVKDFLEDRQDTCVKKVLLINPEECVVREFHRNLGTLFGFHMVESLDKEQNISPKTGKSLL